MDSGLASRSGKPDLEATRNDHLFFWFDMIDFMESLVQYYWSAGDLRCKGSEASGRAMTESWSNDIGKRSSGDPPLPAPRTQ